MYPRLACKINLYPDRVILSQAEREICLKTHGQSGDALSRLFALMDGTKSLTELRQTFGLTEELEKTVQTLNEQGLLEDVSSNRGQGTAQAVGQFARELLLNNHRQNQFWFLLAAEGTEQLANVLYGFAVESYHLFHHQRCSRLAGLTLQSSTAMVRQLMDAVYRQSDALAEGLGKALTHIGIDDSTLKDSLPLPSTMALGQGTLFWACFDTPFYLTILAYVLERLYTDFGDYVMVCGASSLDPNFMESLQRLITPELMAFQKELGDCSVPEMAWLDLDTHQRFVRQTYLLADLFNGFYNAIANHYSETPQLLRRLSVI